MSVQKLEALVMVVVLGFLLGAYQGRVAVFSLSPGGMRQLREVTELRIKDLPPRWAEDIQQGSIKADTEEQLGQILDNLDEWRGSK